MTPRFGKDWHHQGLTLDYLRDSYLRLNPGKEVRPGYQDFHVLQWGLDRLKINREFTEYVIEEVFKRQ